MYKKGNEFSPIVGELFIREWLRVSPYMHNLEVYYRQQEKNPSLVQGVACIVNYTARSFPLAGHLWTDVFPEWYLSCGESSMFAAETGTVRLLDDETLLALRCLWDDKVIFADWVAETCMLPIQEKDKERLRKLLD